MKSNDGLQLVYSWMLMDNTDEENCEELSFGSDYAFRYSIKLNILIYEKNDLFIKNYFNNVLDKDEMNLQIGVLIGKNGSGKSLCMERLLENLLSLEESNYNKKVLLIFQKGKSYVLYSNFEIKIEPKYGTNEKIVIDKREMNELSYELKKTFIAYYAPQISERRIANLESGYNFCNYGLSYRLERSISPMDLEGKSRNFGKVSPHLSGIFDDFQITYVKFFNAKNTLEQIETVIGLINRSNSQDYSFFKIRETINGELIKDKIPRKIKILSDFTEYYSSNFKMIMSNKGNIMGSYDEDVSRLEKYIYRFIGRVFHNKFSSIDVANTILNTFFYRIIDSMIKDIYRNYDLNRFGTEFKNYINTYDIRLEINVSDIDAIHELKIIFDLLKLIINECNFIEDVNMLDKLIRYNMKIIESYENLFIRMYEFISILEIDYEFQTNFNGIQVEVKNIEFQESIRVNGAIKLPSKKIICMDLYIDLSNQEELVISALDKLVNAISNLYSLKMPIRVRWANELSSGEYHKLSLLSMMNSIHKQMMYKRFVDNSNNKMIEWESLIILMDEPDTFMHPEWERNLVEELILITKMYYSELSSVQLILTTNRPILLTDLPAFSVNYINHKNNSMQINTLYKDIHDLYRENFVVKSSVGTFVTKKIERLVNKLRSSNEEISEDDEKLIELIGDEATKKKVKMLYEEWKSKNSKSTIKEIYETIKSNYNTGQIDELLKLLGNEEGKQK